MKEVTYEDWKENPTPRMMWVWNCFIEKRKKLKVVYVSKGIECDAYPVIASLTPDDTEFDGFKHCAEIEKQRRMTNKEISRWLRENPTREWKYKDCSKINIFYTYSEDNKDEEITDNILIREDDGEWREPIIEQE